MIIIKHGSEFFTALRQIIFIGQVGIVFDSPMFRPGTDNTEDIDATETVLQFAVSM